MRGSGSIAQAVNSAVDMVAAGVAQMVLHVPDDRVLPFQEINSPVRADFDIDGTKVGIIGLHQRLDFCSNKAGIFVRDLVLQNAEETDDVSDEQIALHVWRKLTAGENLHPGTRAG